MKSFREIAESKIREAIQNGEFDNLPNQGKPLDLEEYFSTPPHLRMSFHILKNAGVLPQEVQLLREIDELKQKRRASTDPKLRRDLARQIDEKTTELNLILERYRKSRG